MRARRVSAVVAAVFVACAVDACHAKPSGVTEMQGEPPKETWATIHRDVSGWVVHPVDVHGADVHVQDVDTTAVAEAGPPDAQLVLRGTVRGPVFAADAAFRALPGGSWSPDDVFVRLENDLLVEPNLGVAVEASAVFVPLPDRLKSCPRAVRSCPRGTVPAYVRDVDRCLVLRKCIAPSPCTVLPAPCASGYLLRSWRSPPHACPDYACDAAFLPE